MLYIRDDSQQPVMMNIELTTFGRCPVILVLFYHFLPIDFSIRWVTRTLTSHVRRRLYRILKREFEMPGLNFIECKRWPHYVMSLVLFLLSSLFFMFSLIFSGQFSTSSKITTLRRFRGQAGRIQGHVPRRKIAVFHGGTQCSTRTRRPSTGRLLVFTRKLDSWPKQYQQR
jgi:hypothetical protein